MLIDYDTCSNYGNWLYVAGVGTDPREDRYFNVIKQATMYGKSLFCIQSLGLSNQRKVTLICLKY